MNLHLLHQGLDCSVIGDMAVDPREKHIYLDDGSIVVSHTAAAMREWVIARHGEAHLQDELALYGQIIAAMCEEGISYHMDNEAAAKFLRVLACDRRFHPEVLQFQDSSGTLLTSCFDPNNDELSELTEEVASFVVGYLRVTGSGQYTVEGVPSRDSGEANSTPLCYRDWLRLSIPLENFDSDALWRLDSMSPWLQLLCEEDDN
jgi:hypothetical protein